MTRTAPSTWNSGHPLPHPQTAALQASHTELLCQKMRHLRAALTIKVLSPIQPGPVDTERIRVNAILSSTGLKLMNLGVDSDGRKFHRKKLVAHLLKPSKRRVIKGEAVDTE